VVARLISRTEVSGFLGPNGTEWLLIQDDCRTDSPDLTWAGYRVSAILSATPRKPLRSWGQCWKESGWPLRLTPGENPRVLRVLKGAGNPELRVPAKGAIRAIWNPRTAKRRAPVKALIARDAWSCQSPSLWIHQPQLPLDEPTLGLNVGKPLRRQSFSAGRDC